MDASRFQAMIDAWNNLFYTAKKFDTEWGNMKEGLTPNQLAVLKSVNDQHNAWYEEQGLDIHELG